jgi:hypothetical protein
MAAGLSAAQTLTVYHACGLRVEGGTYKLVRFHPFSVSTIEDFTLNYDYSAIKTAIDTNLAALSSDAGTWLGTHITTYDDTLTSSFKMRGEVVLDDEVEFCKARDAIRDLVGVQVELVDEIEAARNAESGGRTGRVAR